MRARRTLPSLERIEDEATRSTSATTGVDDRAQERRHGHGETRDRRRRPALGLPCRGRHRDRRHAYPQTALTFNLRHARPHRDVSTEFHTESGPFTLVPLPGDRSSLVCVVDPDEAEHIARARRCRARRRDRAALAFDPRQDRGRARPRRLPARGRDGARASRRDRIALIGEAAHLIPPIGAQGLNLGLRDAATIGELVVAAHRDGGDLGAPELLARYDACAAPTSRAAAFAVDLLNRSLLSDFLPVQGARGLGPVSDRPARPAAPRRDARRRRASDIAAPADARRGVVTSHVGL